MDVCTREDESARGGGFGARIAGLWRRTSELPAAMMAAVKCAPPAVTVLQSAQGPCRCLPARLVGSSFLRCFGALMRCQVGRLIC